ncbi:ATP-binding protein [Hydrogenophaga sp.]|uniref:ATP-binding protein n=1 Tax=Hydrogenophaga sp. TaxID=1904254 RepID=UPI003566490D
MNAAFPNSAALAPPLSARLFAQLAPAQLAPDAPAEAHWLVAQADELAPLGLDLGSAWTLWQQSPPEPDRALHRLAGQLSLNPSECMALALCHAADTDVIASRALGWLQSPLRDVYPTLGLLASLDAQRGLSPIQSMNAVLDGAALASGLLQLETQGRALPDARLRLPMPLVLALSGGRGHWPGVRLQSQDAASAQARLAPSVRALCRQHAAWLQGGAVMVVRSGHPREARAVCAAIAEDMGRQAAFIEGETPAGLLPWLLLQNALPVWVAELSPGERRRVPAFTGGDLPMLVATGPDGSWENDGEPLAAWQVPVPPVQERAALWMGFDADPDTATELAAGHRHASARIEELARAAHALCRSEGGAGLAVQHVARAARAPGQGALGSLAQLLPEDIHDEALVMPSALRAELLALVARCRRRDALAQDLGPAIQARYRPGVRALLVGPSGTGKTLASGWLATQLGMPLYRVDLASVSSKYIGETEKNLGELFARAEHAEVVLLFDEADAMFGKRTDVKDANDRFANQQTNYLLQRIEAFDGIVLLTSNSRARFDPAFTRRLDSILEFPLPGPEDRRALWLAHLGPAHQLSTTELNRLAAGCDFAGGHVRNAVLGASALAGTGRLDWAAMKHALAAEYRKLGKAMPAVLGNGH